MSATVPVVDSRDVTDCLECNGSYSSFAGLCQHYRKAHSGTILLRKNCHYCGIEMVRKPGDFHPEAERHFCSDMCRNDWRSGENSERIDVECEWCGETVEKKPSRVERAERNYCSPECHGNWKSENLTGENAVRWEGGKPETDCDTCGETFKIQQRRLDVYENNFCSEECQGKWLSATNRGESHPNYRDGAHDVTNCDYCNEEFEYYPSSTPGLYCSLTCARKDKTGTDHPRWTGGRPSYGEGWDKEKRQSVRQRDNMECQNCGISQSDHLETVGRKLHVHHRKPAKEFDDAKDRNKMGNLVTLCATCHRKREVA